MSTNNEYTITDDDIKSMMGGEIEILLFNGKSIKGTINEITLDCNILYVKLLWLDFNHNLPYVHKNIANCSVSSVECKIRLQDQYATITLTSKGYLNNTLANPLCDEFLVSTQGILSFSILLRGYTALFLRFEFYDGEYIYHHDNGQSIYISYTPFAIRPKFYKECNEKDQN